MIRLIAAIDRQNGIAKHGFQPWSIPPDERYFNEQTKSMGGRVLMGQRTLEVIGHPLKDRQNFVLSHEAHSVPGVTYVTDLGAFLDEAAGTDIWVVGGASVFEQTLARADELYLTRIEADFGCDQFFPSYSDDFKLRQSDEPHEANGFIFSYSIYAKHR